MLPGASDKVKYTDIAVRSLTCHTAAETHMPYGITQCYLSPDRGDIPAFTLAEAGTQLSDPGGMQGWVDLVGGWPVTYRDGIPARRWSPIQLLTGPDATSFMRRTRLMTMPRRQYGILLH